MKVEALKNAFTSKVARQILVTKKNSPTIFFAAGVVGVVGSTVLACKATLKLEEVLDEAEVSRNLANDLVSPNYSDRDRQTDLVKIKVRTVGKIAKLYSPAIVVGGISIAALTGSHVTLTRRNTAIMAAYSALDKGFKEYRDRVREELGDEKDLEFRHGSETRVETVEGKKGSETVEYKAAPPGVPSIYARFFDDSSRNWSRSPENNMFFLNCQQNYLNDRLRSRGHVFLNEVYDALGMKRTTAGQVVGWIISKDGDNFIDFGVYDGEKERNRAFVNGEEGSILLDFNVDGVVYDLIEEGRDGY